MKLSTFFISSVAALNMLSPVYAWDATDRAACEALAARSEAGFEDLLRYDERHYSQFNYKGWDLWQLEAPKLLRDVARTGNVNLISPSGFSALQVACYYADVKLAKALLTHGADVNMRPMGWNGYGFPGDTPIALLVRGMSAESASARVQIARMLMQCGANPDADMTHWYWGASAPVTPFCYLTEDAFNNEMRMVLVEGGAKDLRTRTRTWDFTWQCYTPELIRKLLEGGVSPNRSVGPDGTTLLLHLVKTGNIELVKLALSKGADLKAGMQLAKHHGDYLFAISVGKEDSADAALAMAKVLVDAKANLKSKFNGKSLYAYYSKIDTPAAQALTKFFAGKGILR